MAKKNQDPGGKPDTNVQEKKGNAKVYPARKDLPLWKVLLHNDNKNQAQYVVDTIVELLKVPTLVATEMMYEAHSKKVSLLVTTYKERAELYQEQFTSKKLTVTIEPA